jgi:CDP-diacylglycerol--glycerol-3-phosphate 3-phosphatidyltransferase
VPSTYSLKPEFQRLLRPAARRLVAAGLTPNEVTLCACSISVAAGVFLTLRRLPQGWFLLLPVTLFLRMGLNAIDGMMAREFGQQTRLGAYLNELTDVVSDAFLILPFAYVPGVNPFWIGITIVLAMVSEMTGALGVMIGASRRYEGPMGKSDRAVVFGALALWLGLGRPVVPQVLKLIPASVSLLIVLTICNRVRAGLVEARTPPSQLQGKR